MSPVSLQQPWDEHGFAAFPGSPCVVRSDLRMLAWAPTGQTGMNTTGVYCRDMVVRITIDISSVGVIGGVSLAHQKKDRFDSSTAMEIS